MRQSQPAAVCGESQAHERCNETNLQDFKMGASAVGIVGVQESCQEPVQAQPVHAGDVEMSRQHLRMAC